MPFEEKTGITAGNLFTDPIEFDNDYRFFNVSIVDQTAVPPFVATVTVQRRFGAGDAWRDVKQYVAAAEEIGEMVEGEVQYRVGVKTGDFTSGEIDVRISY